MKRFLGFTASMAALIAVTGWLCTLVFTGPEAARAIAASAGVAFSVQLITFGIAQVLAPSNVLAGWGAGMLVRLLTLAIHGFVGIRILGVPMDAALVSLAAFFFVTTLIEPLFLTRPAPSTLRATQ